MLVQQKTQRLLSHEQQPAECHRPMQYPNDIEKTISLLEKRIHGVTDAKANAMNAMETVCEFYDADWCGILDADMEIGIWTPYWWYDAHTKGMTETNFERYESTSPYPRWNEAMMKNIPLIVGDSEEIKDSYPDEYQQYQKQNMHSLIANPYCRRSTGFLVVKNPKKYVDRPGMLQVVTYVIATELNEYKLMTSYKLMSRPQELADEKDVAISVFGGLKIRTSKGTITEDDIHSPMVCKALVYILLNTQRGISPREIMDKIWPEEASDDPGKKIRQLIYRFRQAFSAISDVDLIITNTSGYSLNPELNVVTDAELFEQYWRDSVTVIDKRTQLEMMEKALDLYQGVLLPSANGEHWLNQYTAFYHSLYLFMASKVLCGMAECENYQKLLTVALEANKVEAGSVDFYYWAVFALQRQGAAAMVRQQLEAAKKNLLQADYDMLVQRLDNK